MVLGKLPVPGRPTIWITVGQGPRARCAVGAGGGCLDIFTLIYPFFPPSSSLWETDRYRLKYCLKGPLNPKQPTNQPKVLDHSVTLLYIDISLIINGSFIVARAFYAHVLCPCLDKMCMKIYANSRYKDKSAQTIVCQSKHSS